MLLVPFHPAHIMTPLKQCATLFMQCHLLLVSFHTMLHCPCFLLLWCWLLHCLHHATLILCCDISYEDALPFICTSNWTTLQLFHCTLASFPNLIVLHTMKPCPSMVLFSVVTLSMLHHKSYSSTLHLLHHISCGDVFLIFYCTFYSDTIMPPCPWVISVFFFSLPTVPPAKRTTNSGGKTPWRSDLSG